MIHHVWFLSRTLDASSSQISSPQSTMQSTKKSTTCGREKGTGISDPLRPRKSTGEESKAERWRRKGGIEDTRRIPWTRRRPTPAARRCPLLGTGKESTKAGDGDSHFSVSWTLRAFWTDEVDLLGWAIIEAHTCLLFLWIFVIHLFTTKNIYISA